jgi:hypothetical protein
MYPRLYKNYKKLNPKFVEGKKIRADINEMEMKGKMQRIKETEVVL